MAAIMRLGEGYFLDHTTSDGTKIYAASKHASSAECGRDCHRFVAVADGEEIDLGEILDDLPGDEMTAEAVRRLHAEN